MLVWWLKIFQKADPLMSSSVPSFVSVSPINLISLPLSSFLSMCPWQVPRQGLSGCGREGGERLNPHSSVSSRHSLCACRGCWEGADPGPRQQGTVTSSLLCSSPPASNILLTANLTYFIYHQPSHTETPSDNAPPYPSRQGNAPILSPQRLQQNSCTFP